MGSQRKAPVEPPSMRLIRTCRMASRAYYQVMIFPLDLRLPAASLRESPRHAHLCARVCTTRPSATLRPTAIADRKRMYSRRNGAAPCRTWIRAIVRAPAGGQARLQVRRRKCCAHQEILNQLPHHSPSSTPCWKPVRGARHGAWACTPSRHRGEPDLSHEGPRGVMLRGFAMLLG